MHFYTRVTIRPPFRNSIDVSNQIAKSQGAAVDSAGFDQMNASQAKLLAMTIRIIAKPPLLDVNLAFFAGFLIFWQGRFAGWSQVLLH